jgi:hypothetical protein
LLGEKINRNSQGAFFPRARYALLVVLHGIFAAVKCN